MKVVIQKSGPAKVQVNGETKGEIEKGLVVLLGITNGDSEKDVDYLVEKVVNLRLFEENEKHFDKSILEDSNEVLVISQFTLYASCKKGRRPDFAEAAKGDIAKPLYENFVSQMRQKGVKVETGEFGAEMEISLTNMGPVTIIIESPSNN